MDAAATVAERTDERALRDEVQHETRFAVVLYGGVSLAVYISGVCQELLHMTRATSFERWGEAPAPEEVAYRLASMLVDGDVADRSAARARIESVLDEYEAAPGDDASRVDVLHRATATCRPRRRFFVDVLTGSSAGGLNAVFLSKALTHDQSIEHLTRLWVEQGGFESILNDQDAARLHDAAVSDHAEIDVAPVRSLLSGDLMSLKLYSALTDMDRDSPPGMHLVDALDCYLTTTDLRGLVLPVHLSDDRSVRETRHRCVFHLAYGTPLASGGQLDQLSTDWNRHLAFIARATSAHPAAFEPAQIVEYAGLLGSSVAHFDPSPDVTTDGFLARRMSPRLLYAPWDVHMARRWYSDGGDMDNKPFSYVLHPLRNRRAEVPVDRQLLFVEPDPAEHRAELLPAEQRPPFGAVTLGAFNLGRTENIREDIERVLDRNTTIKRLKRGFDEQIGVLANRSPTRRDDAMDLRDRWSSATYRDLLEHSEVDLAYEFHKTMWLGGELGSTMANVAGFAADSAQTRWLVDMTQQYAQMRYIPERLDDVLDGPTRHRNFLLSLDLGYRLRRLMFVDKALRRMQEELQGRGPGALFEKWGLDHSEIDLPTLRACRRRLNEIDVDLRCVGRHLRAGTAEDAFHDRLVEWERDPEWRSRWGDEPRTEDIDESTLFAQKATRLGRWPDDLDRWRGRLRDLATRDMIDGSALTPTDDEVTLLDAIVEEVGAVLRPWLLAASAKANLAIDETLAHTTTLHALIKAVYQEYDQFDHFVLPSWGDARGELAEAEVTRVSPLDATRLMSVSKIPDHEINKLAGNSLAHFGGFLSDDWRRNDIMWGRLDAAEIVLARLLPSADDRAVRDRLVDLAHDRILASEWSTVRALRSITRIEALNEIPESVDPAAGRRFIQNDLNVSLDTRGRVKPALVRRVLDVLGGVTSHHWVDEPERAGAGGRGLGRIMGMVVRVMRVGYPPQTGHRNVFVMVQRFVYLLMMAAAVFAVGWGVAVGGWTAGLVATAFLIPGAGFAATFVSADLRRSRRRNLLTGVAILVPFGILAWSLVRHAEATFAIVAGVGVFILALQLAGPPLFVRWQIHKLLSRRDDTELRPPNVATSQETFRSRAHVFAAVTDPDRLVADGDDVRRVSGAGSLGLGDRFEVSAVDPRDSARRVRFLFEVIELVENRRIVFSWGIVGDDVLPPHGALSSVHLRESGPAGPGGTVAEIRSTFATRRDGDVPEVLARHWHDQLCSSVADDSPLR